MNSTLRNFIKLSTFLLICKGGYLCAAEATGDAEAQFRGLRAKVSELKIREPLQVLNRLEVAAPHIVDCPNEDPSDSKASIGIDGVDYAYTNIYVKGDSDQHCFYMVEPFRRALTAEEGRDFSAALTMPDMPRFFGGQPAAETVAARAASGERHLRELQSILGEKHAKLIDDEIAEAMGIRPIGDLNKLVDCSHDATGDLDRQASAALSMRSNGAIYNDSYVWEDIDTATSRCIYMLRPMQRGLSIDEARTLLTAQHLDLEFSDEMRAQNPGMEPTSKAVMKAKVDQVGSPADKKN